MFGILQMTFKMLGVPHPFYYIGAVVLGLAASVWLKRFEMRTALYYLAPLLIISVLFFTDIIGSSFLAISSLILLLIIYFHGRYLSQVV